MENQLNQGNENHAETETEEIPDEFQCCVCLELLYKPVVIGCGHIACFWCVFKAMNSLQESSCPICRHQYHHFPRVCRLMHFLLLKLYPLAYKRREMQVAEEEKVKGFISPQFDEYASEACTKELVVKDTSSPHSIMVLQGPDFATERETSLIHGLSKNSEGGDKIMEQNPKEGLMSDLKCEICKLLLYGPVVLNCGHVYCADCVFNQCDKLCRCPVCQMEHPNGYPNVCLVLQHFLEEQFPEEYAARKRTSFSKSDSEPAITSTCQIKRNKADHSLATKHDYQAWLSGKGPTVHYRVGCDYCGMYPIVGDRYKCQDCKEAIGFDLCQACYNSSSNLPGRFNQQHTPEHNFKLIRPVRVGNWLLVRDPQQLSADGPVYAYVQNSIELGSAPFNPTESTAGSISAIDNGEDTNPYLDALGNHATPQNDNGEDPNSASDNTRNSA